MTLDKQMAEIRAGKDPKSRLRMIVRPQDVGINETKNVHVNTAKMLKDLHKRGVDINEFIKDACDRNFQMSECAEKYKVKKHVIGNARLMPNQFLINYNTVNNILDKEIK